MEINRVSSKIVKILNKQYDKFIKNECIDVVQIKNICNLYNNNNNNNNKIHDDSNNLSLSEINFSSPEFTKYNGNRSNKNHLDVLRTREFIKKYSFFIKVIYACLKLQINMFNNVDDTIITLKNNYQILKSLESKKKQLISQHIEILNNQKQNLTKKISEAYDYYLSDYMIKIKIIDKIYVLLHALIDNNVLENKDNMLSLILPYFYVYPEYIEEYN